MSGSPAEGSVSGEPGPHDAWAIETANSSCSSQSALSEPMELHWRARWLPACQWGPGNGSCIQGSEAVWRAIEAGSIKGWCGVNGGRGGRQHATGPGKDACELSNEAVRDVGANLLNPM